MAGKTYVIGGKKMTIALEALERKITKGGDLHVGFLEGTTYPETTTERFLKAVGSSAPPKVNPRLPVAQVAFWNEFGTATAPSRPFFRTTIAERSSAWGNVLAAALKTSNYDGEAALRILGQSMRDDVESAIAQWSAPENAPLTIKIKGFDKPLIDSGKMQGSVDFEIVK